MYFPFKKKNIIYNDILYNTVIDVIKINSYGDFIYTKRQRDKAKKPCITFICYTTEVHMILPRRLLLDFVRLEENEIKTKPSSPEVENLIVLDTTYKKFSVLERIKQYVRKKMGKL